MSVFKRIQIGRNPTDFKQHDLFLKGRCLVLRDHRNSGPGAVTIQSGQVTRADVADVDFLRSGVSLTEVQVTPLAHAVCHLDEANRNDVDFFESDGDVSARPKVVILQASTAAGGVSWPHERCDDTVWLSMKDRMAYSRVSEWSPQFLNLSFEDAATIAQAPDRSALAKFEGGFSRILDITHPGDPTAPLAFRLLCEAWYEKNVNGNNRINAPGSLEEWLNPFNVKGDSESDRMQAVVALMRSEDREVVKKVLKAANEKQNLAEAVKAFPGFSVDSSPGGGRQ